MHRALNIAEVVHTIIQFLSPTYVEQRFPYWRSETISTKKTNLLNAALACRAFSGPALDALWYCMVSLEPLFRLLSDVRCPNSNKMIDGLLWGSISKTNLRTVQKYASRIRICYFVDDNISIFTYMHFLRACGHPCLLPNLNFLDATLPQHADSAIISKALFLVSPALREVRITAPTSTTLPFLNSLQTYASNFTILNILATTALTNLHFISAICSFPKLQTVDINVFANAPNDDQSEPSLDIIFFTRIASNQTLRHFRFNGKTRLVSSKADLGCGIVEFPVLEDISLGFRHTSIGPITTLLHHVTLPSLKSLMIKLDMSVKPPVGSTEARYWNQFFYLIGDVTTTQNSLKHLTILSHLAPVNTLWKDVDLSVSKFPNLDRLSLETFRIQPPILHLDKIDVQKIIKFWPGLQHLDLQSCQPFKLGFNVLIDIALGLPNLRLLVLPILSMDVEEPSFLEEFPLLGHGLSFLNLDILSNTTEPPIMHFVQCIDKIFPRLVGWTFHCSNYRDFDLKATPILKMLQRARGYEAKRISLSLEGAHDR